MELVNTINNNLNNLASLDKNDIKKIQNIIKNNILQTIVKYDVSEKKEKAHKKAKVADKENIKEQKNISNINNLDIKKLKLKELQDLCVKNKLNKYGNKSVLQERLLNYFNTHNSVADNSVADNSIANNSVADNSIADNSIANNSVTDNSIADNYINKYIIKDNDIRKINNLNDDILNLEYKNSKLDDIIKLIKSNINDNKEDINKNIKEEFINKSNINHCNNKFKNIIKDCNITINTIEFIGYIDYNDTFLISTSYNIINSNENINYNGYLSFEINIIDDLNITYILSDLMHNIVNNSFLDNEIENNYKSCLEHYKKILILFHI